MSKKPDMFDRENLRQIAYDAYIKKLSISAIAEKWGVAHGTITSALKRAALHGIVEFIVKPEELPRRLPRLARDIEEKYDLKHVDLVPTFLDAAGVPLPSVIPTIAHRTAQYLDEELDNDSRLAVSGGRQFVRQVASYLEPRKLDKLEVLPLSGFIRAQANVGDASLIAYDIATKYSAKYSWLPIPAFVESQSDQDIARQLPIVRDVLKKIYEEANIFLIQYFAPFSRKLESQRIFSKDMMKAIRASKPEFNIDLWFFNRKGDCINDTVPNFPFHLTGYNINDLARKVQEGAKVILVAGTGQRDAKVIQVILEKKLANVLITDHSTATKLKDA